MAECIEREAVLRDWPLCDEPADAYQYIRSYPAADVRPVVRGEWKDGGKSALFPMQDIYRCSECDYHYFTMFNFCPNCGADMREES